MKCGHQFGRTSDGYDLSKKYFSELCEQPSLDLAEAVDALRTMHKNAPFLFMNGNTFCYIGQWIIAYHGKFSETSMAGVISIATHHIAGVEILDFEKLRHVLEVQS